MMYYRYVRKILFILPAEFSHTLTLKLLKFAHTLRLLRQRSLDADACDVMGIHFPNKVGLAAGLDKNGDYIDCLGCLGFGFIEIGTVTPKPQSGNVKPRLFRIDKAQALINRMGFNNKGVDYLVERVKQRQYPGILGINIGKNAITPMERAVDDYLFCLERVYPYADYIVINISSPNTEKLRELQQQDNLTVLLRTLKNKQKQLHTTYQRYVPLLVKVAPDLTEEEILQITHVVLDNAIDGMVVSNTTLSRTGIEALQYANEKGGLSGKPLTAQATDVLRQFAHHSQGKIPLIGVGGIMTTEDANEKFSVGADLIQIYTGLIYQGPGFIKAILQIRNE